MCRKRYGNIGGSGKYDIGYKQQEDPNQVIAITYLVEPLLTTIADQKEDANTLFIANARTDVPKLIAEIKRLKMEIFELKSKL